jgi:hypothetical protein
MYRYVYVYGVVLRHVHVQTMYAMYGGCSLRLYKHVTDAPTGMHRSTKIYKYFCTYFIELIQCFVRVQCAIYECAIVNNCVLLMLATQCVKVPTRYEYR